MKIFVGINVCQALEGEEGAMFCGDDVWKVYILQIVCFHVIMLVSGFAESAPPTAAVANKNPMIGVRRLT